MSSSSREIESGREDNEDTPGMERMEQMQQGDEAEEFGELQRADTRRSSISAILEEEMAAGVDEPEETVLTGKGYHEAEVPPTPLDERAPREPPMEEKPSPSGSLPSIPDDTPSVHRSVASSPRSSVLPSIISRPGLGSPTPSFRPFDRRFAPQLGRQSSVYSPRSGSPAFLSTHSRQTSVNSQMFLDQAETESPTPPWEVVRWTKLKKLNGQIFSEPGRRNFGTPTCIAVSASIVLGTSKGIILVFDYHQNLKSIIGPGTKAVEAGAITSLAISADHSTVAGGHVNGDIFTWEIAKAARPFLHIPHLDRSQIQNQTIDGHCPNVAVTHLGFLGMRHTAVVSADSRGMAFSHLATRGTGLVGRRVKTARILGRYPQDNMKVEGKPRKPSTILGFAALPLGNVERGMDSMGLTAMLTPHLLVIVSTTPIAETQHKSSRPKEVEPHSAMSGCLAWFPSVKLKNLSQMAIELGQTISKVKLVYCWSNVLSVMDVEEYPSEDGVKQPTLHFQTRSRWKAEEAIVAVQWLSRSVLAVLTITQRLIILEDNTMRMTEAFDLMNRHIYHKDVFSEQLHKLVEEHDEEDPLMHGVVADAFYMSFKAYKGRMFLLGFNDVSIGAVSNWADRLIALMENGDYIGAVHLATSYFTGDADKLTIGLPEDANLRHSMVRDKLLEIMTASLKFAFGSGKRDVSQDERTSELKELAAACFTAALSISDVDYIFEDIYEWYADGGALDVFFDTLEPYILEEEIIVVPPVVVKSLVSHYVEEGQSSRLEDLLCRMETATLDIDQVTGLCKKHNLYDALLYIWTQALSDYITPLIDLLKLLVPLVKNEDYFTNTDVVDDPVYVVNALKMFPYLSYAFTGRIYPTGEPLTEPEADKAKAEIYWFLFSGNTITWPEGSSKALLTMPLEQDEPSFPYLRMILKFDAPSLLSCLNEAFEDAFLNHSPENEAEENHSGTEWEIFGRSANRQYIVTILLEVMNPNDFAPEDTIYLDMFIAQNLAKFPQYLLLSGTSLHKTLTGLCNYPGEDLAEDAQLSAEYLLSVYHPTDIKSLIPLFEKARFYRVLKSIYRNDKQFAKLIETYFEDPNDQELVFDCIADCLRPENLSQKHVAEIHAVITRHARELVHIDAVKSAHVMDIHAPSLHQTILDGLSEDSDHEYLYLQTLLEPAESTASPSKVSGDKSFIERYVRLMCSFDSAHVADYIEAVQASDLRLDKVLSAMEESGVVDAAVILMAREGLVNDAMKRLTDHLGKLEAALTGLLSSADQHHEPNNVEAAAEELLEALQKYTGVGIWLCQKNTKTAAKQLTRLQRRQCAKQSELSTQELLWLDLIDAVVQITKSLSSSLTSLPDSAASHLDIDKLLATVRTLVQRTFTALLTATSGPSGASLSFLRILRAFLTRASVSSPTISDLRSVLASIFSAYAYEKSIMDLANRLLDKDLFVNVESVSRQRMRGWRPRGAACEGCKVRVWGPGVGEEVLSKWEELQREEESKRLERRIMRAGGKSARGKQKAKAQHEDVYVSQKAPVVQRGGMGGTDDEEDAHRAVEEKEELGPLVVFACRHLYHQTCLERLLEAQKENDGGKHGDGFRCPIDS